MPGHAGHGERQPGHQQHVRRMGAEDLAEDHADSRAGQGDVLDNRPRRAPKQLPPRFPVGQSGRRWLSEAVDEQAIRMRRGPGLSQ